MGEYWALYSPVHLPLPTSVPPGAQKAGNLAQSFFLKIYTSNVGAKLYHSVAFSVLAEPCHHHHYFHLPLPHEKNLSVHTPTGPCPQHWGPLTSFCRGLALLDTAPPWNFTACGLRVCFLS